MEEEAEREVPAGVEESSCRFFFFFGGFGDCGPTNWLAEEGAEDSSSSAVLLWSSCATDEATSVILGLFFDLRL